MSAPTYTFDQQVAESAGGPSRIDTSGAYVGRFTRAEASVAGTGSRGIEFDFESVDGASARWIRVWATRPDGSPISYGMGSIQAMIGLLGLGGLTPAPTLDADRRPTEHYPQLLGVPIGLLLQAEQYSKSDRSTGTRMNLVMPFDATTRQTFDEKASGSAADTLDRRLRTTSDIIATPQAAPTQATRAPAAVPAGFEDSVPF